MNRRNRNASVLETPETTVSEGKIVEVNVDHSLETVHLFAREAVKEEGKISLFELKAMFPRDQGPVEIEIKPLEPKEWLGSRIYESVKDNRYNLEVVGHTNDISNLKKGVIDMSPFQLFKKEASVLFTAVAPYKAVAAGTYATAASFFNFPLFSQLGWLALFGVADLLLGLIPGNVPKNTKRSSVIFSRFWQWAGSLIFLAGLIGVQQAGKGSNTGGLGGLVAGNIYTIGTGFVITAYSFRMIGAFFKIFYGSKASKVKKKYTQFLPKKLQQFFNDNDIAG